MMKASKGLVDWRKLARDLAREAHEDHFPELPHVWWALGRGYSGGLAS